MANQMGLYALQAMHSGVIDIESDDIHCLICMDGTNATASTARDAVNLDDLTLDEATYSGYARKSVASGDFSIALSVDNANDRTVATVTWVNNWTGLGGDEDNAGSALLFYKHIDGTAANDLYVCTREFASNAPPSTATAINPPSTFSMFRYIQSG